MAFMPYMQEQNKGKNTGRYRISQLSSVLSKVQTGKPSECKKTEYVNCKRARRIGSGT